MASMSRGTGNAGQSRKTSKAYRVVKPKRSTRHTTTTTKNYRFQSFTQRIAHLKIDPIRRKRHVDAHEAAADDVHSFLAKSLDEWRDLNLSRTFTLFAKDSAPLCDSLPVVLYNENKIMDLLVAYIEQGDALAMEPLLSLLSHFAHDLDSRFEKHFQRAVGTVAAVAAKHADFAVIEWSFSCLAWLFKYLSRLLTPDLRPLYDLMVPYLGKTNQRPFVIRFTAEALSFLVKKAATIYEKDNGPLDLIVEHMLKDCVTTDGTPGADLYQQGVMTLLTEAIKGIQNGVHTGGLYIMQSLLKFAAELSEARETPLNRVVCGILTSLIHHSTTETFQPVLDAIIEYSTVSAESGNATRIRLSSDILFTAVSVRKATRIHDWNVTMEAIKDLFSACDRLQSFDVFLCSSLLRLLAVSMQFANINAVLATRQTLESLRRGSWASQFPRFCDLFARLGSERFQTFLLPCFRKYVLELADGGNNELYALIARLGREMPDINLHCHSKMIEATLDKFAHISQGLPQIIQTSTLAESNARLAALPHIFLGITQSQHLNTLLLKIVNDALHELSDGPPELMDFALGTCLRHLLRPRHDISELDHLWSPLCTVSPHMSSLPQYWSNLKRFIELCPPTNLEEPHVVVLQEALISCLASPSHQIREHALNILHQLYRLRKIKVPDMLATAATIESTPISLDTTRSISMNIRRLAPEYANLEEGDIMIKAIPTYSFGLLHLRLSQAWEDAISALAIHSRSRGGEEVIMSLVQTWIEGKPENEDVPERPAILDVNSDGFRVFSDFECPNLAKLSAISIQVFEDASGFPSVMEQLAIDQQRIPPITPGSRGQALRVLHKIPQLAEKRSRMLVPVLLRWAGHAFDEDLVDSSEGERWARKDQKAMLAVFAQFVNPKVLYKANDVRDALLKLCANGDVEIQQSALKALLAWKEHVITRYQEHLNNLLDEARFREELSVFLTQAGEDADADADGIRPEDQSKLMPVLLRLIYGRAVAGGKEAQAGRRKAIFVALSRFGEDTMEHFLDIALPSNVQYGIHSPQARAPLRQQFGMLNMLNDMLQILGAELEPFVSRLMEGILACTVTASQQLDQEGQDLNLSLLRSVRQSGMQCLVKIFSHMKDFEPEHYGTIIARELLSPRLNTFANENTQSISATLRLFAAWSTRTAAAKVLAIDGGKMLSSISLLLRSQHTKPEVQLYILQEIFDNLLVDELDDNFLKPYVPSFVQAIGTVLEQQPSKEVLDACVRSFSRLSGRITSGGEAADITRICTGLLVKPSKSVSATTKTGLLQTLLPLIQNFDIDARDELYTALSALFSRLQQPESRELLSQAVIALVRPEAELLEVAEVCEHLNAMGSRLDEPDHERRELAFAWIYNHAHSMSLKEWLPIVHNCLFYIRDDDDRVNRSSASHALQLFIDTASSSAESDIWLPLLDSAVLTGIERGMKEPSELVRAEYLAVLGHLVESFRSWPKVNGMQSLVVGGDDEASFFSNILHIQQHRRLRALRRLMDEALNIQSSSASRILLPLLEHFVFDQVEGDAGRTLADQTVQTIGSLAKVLNRQSFRATFQRYTGYLKSKVEMEKVVLRLLGAMVDSIQRSDQRTSQAMIEEQLPPLMEYLHLKDESTVDRRMPVAVTIVKLMLALPQTELGARLPAVLTDVSHVLRSRSQEARDQTRKALAAISKLIGPNYFKFILKELRSALQRGYQLHVLSFTVHALLVDADFALGDLDECLPEMMLVILDDIFGITGQEKDAEEYKSGMKEVKSSKSFDTMEMLARVTPIARLGELIRPIRALLSEKLDMKMVKKVDDLLARLRKGLDQNPGSESRDMLSFCWEIVSQVYAEQSATPSQAAKIDERVKRYLVQPDGPKSSKMKGASTSYGFKLISFALNLLRKVVRRHEDLQTPQNMSGFLPMAGDALIQGQEEVKLSAVRLLSTIMRVPIPQLDTNAPIYVREALTMVKGATSITSDSAKAGLELITSVLREKRSVAVKEKDIGLLLSLIQNDLDEPDRQSIIFRFLRAVLGRKIVITEAYEVMDEVGKAMVTNPDRAVRESARSAYLQFVMEYPQGKDRWQKQTSFLIGNLQYEHAAGRQSVMEFLHQMLSKIGDDVMAETSPRVFVSLLPVIVSDSDNACREMARLLVGKLFERAGDTQLAQFSSMMETWLKKEKKATTKAGALQCWTVLLRTKSIPVKQLETFRDRLEDILGEYVGEDTINEPQLVLDALQTFSVLIETAPTVGFAEAASDLWQTLQQLPSSDNSQVEESVASLLGTLFTDFASTSSKSSGGLAGLPLQGSGGLELGAEDMRRLCSVNLRTLRGISFTTNEALTTHIVRNVVFLGRCLDANGMPWYEQQQLDSASEEDDQPDTQDIDPDTTSNRSAISRLLHRLSSMIMSDKFSIMSRTAVLACISSLLNQITSIPNLQTIVRPLYALTDPSVPNPPGELFKAFEDKGRELLEALQKKTGSEVYVKELAKARKDILSKREERRRKRRIEAVSQPDKWVREKRRKYAGKKERVKAKGDEARGKRRGW